MGLAKGGRPGQEGGLNPWKELVVPELGGSMILIWYPLPKTESVGLRQGLSCLVGKFDGIENLGRGLFCVQSHKNLTQAIGIQPRIPRASRLW